MKQLTQEQIDKLNSQEISTEGLLFEDDVEGVEFTLKEEKESENEASASADALSGPMLDEDFEVLKKHNDHWFDGAENAELTTETMFDIHEAAFYYRCVEAAEKDEELRKILSEYGIDYQNPKTCSEIEYELLVALHETVLAGKLGMNRPTC